MHTENGSININTSSIEGGPIELARTLISYCRQNSVISIMYFYRHTYSSFHSNFPHILLENEKPFSRHSLPTDHAEALNRCHEFVLNLARPIHLSEYLPVFSSAQPKFTKEIMREAGKFGVVDQLMVPVFGPYNIDGVVSFGFSEKIKDDWGSRLQFLEGAAAVFHNRMVRYFADHSENVELSAREQDVLKWIAKGKSSTDIATILGIQRSSVDTYTRRIFEKLGVHDRVSAAVNGLVNRLISYD